MTAFREQMRADFENVFLNTEEFGRVCSWNGYPLTIAEDASLEKEEFGANAVNVMRKRVICRDIDLTPPPKITEQVLLDGEYWQVTDVQTPFAHLKITLERVTT